ncbi:MAG: hypothetical protein ACRD2G_12075 [Terriglobia bacterium]
MRRKVLVLEGESSIRSAICLLLGARDCEDDGDHSGREALAAIEPKGFDAVLLDLRSPDVPQVAPEISRIQPRRMGRILFITGEVSGPDVLKMIERNCARCARRGNLFQELRQRLRLVFSQTESASEQIEG